MTKEQKFRILSLIQKAAEVREESLSPENCKEMGYSFYSGYATSTLESIQRILNEDTWTSNS